MKCIRIGREQTRKVYRERLHGGMEHGIYKLRYYELTSSNPPLIIIPNQSIFIRTISGSFEHKKVEQKWNPRRKRPHRGQSRHCLSLRPIEWIRNVYKNTFDIWGRPREHIIVMAPVHSLRIHRNSFVSRKEIYRCECYSPIPTYMALYSQPFRICRCARHSFET